MSKLNGKPRFVHRIVSGISKAALAVLPLAAAWLLASVALIIWHGGRWRYTIPHLQWTLGAATPLPRVIWATLCLLGWYLLRAWRRGRPIPWKALLGNVVILSVSLSLSLVAAEWGFRRYLRYTQGFNTIEKFIEYEEGGAVRPRSGHPVAYLITLSPNRKLIYEMRRGMDMIFGPVRILSNGAGMRDLREYGKQPPAGTVRIVGIGDSGMFGWDVPQDETYLARLEDSLNGREDLAQAYQVLNFGVPGYNSQQEVELLAYRAMEYGPDIVVVGWSNNDYDAPFFMHEPRDFSRWDRSLVLTFLVSRKTFYEVIKPNVLIYGAFRGKPMDPDILAGMGREGVKRSLQRLQGLAREGEFEVLVFGPMDDMAVSICRELDLNCYNTNEEIGADEYPSGYGVHEMHPSPEGHGILALHLEKALESSMLLHGTLP
ncbi:SGNH/GDSL hydrolase family protein [Candidatus Moduliflexota bacterium]